MIKKYRKSEEEPDELFDIGRTTGSQQHTQDVSVTMSSKKSLVGNDSGDMGTMMAERGRALTQDIPTFREFALYISDQVVACIPHVSHECHEPLDVHWQPLHDRCAPCDISYDVIVKVSDILRDFAMLVLRDEIRRRYKTLFVKNEDSPGATHVLFSEIIR